MGKKRVTRSFFVHRLRQAYEQRLVDQGFDALHARQLATATELLHGPGRGQPKPPAAADSRAVACLEVASSEVKAVYAL